MNVEKRQLEFGEALRRLRAQAGYVTARDFARDIGWQSSKVSRIENGRTLPSVTDLDAWLDATDPAPEIGARLYEDLREIRLAREAWRRQLRRGHARRQHQEAVSEQEAKRITSVEMFLVPGLVQTADYARAVFAMAADLHGTPQDTEEAVRERLRRQEVLYDSNKQIEILVHELALRAPLAGPEVMSPQLDRLGTLSGMTHIRLGIIPLDAVIPTVTMHGYTIHDDTVIVEINHTEVVTDDRDDLALYRTITERLWDAALEGEAAQALVMRLAARKGS